MRDTDTRDGAAELSPGPTLGAVVGGRYRLVERIGRGGMADVWSAQDSVLDRRVAVKLFRFDTPAINQQRIQAEIRTLARLQHPGVVTVFDAGAQPDPDTDGLAQPYLVMELVDGATLADRLAAGPLPLGAVARLARRLATTLTYVHGQGVVHRDIKPANILIPSGPSTTQTEGDDAKLTDFGIARLADSTRFTASGYTLGTANYLAPEQATGTGAGPGADIYALGLVLIECITGKVAYPGTGIEAALARLHRQPEIPHGLPGPWPALLAAMTAADAAQRPTASDVLTELSTDRATVAVGPGLPDTPTAAIDVDDVKGLASSTRAFTPPLQPPAAGPHPQAERQPSVRVRRPAWLLLAAAVVVLVMILGVALSSRGTLVRTPSSAPTTTTAGTPKPSYPAVGGQLGTKLRQLEDAVG